MMNSKPEEYWGDANRAVLVFNATSIKKRRSMKLAHDTTVIEGGFIVSTKKLNAVLPNIEACHSGNEWHVKVRG
jgi:hypothetical protein